MINPGRIIHAVAALSAGALATLLFAPSWAQTPPAHPPGASTGEKIPVEAFQGPQLKPGRIAIEAPDNGDGLSRDDHNVTPPASAEGWVTLSMMVDPRGKAFQVVVTDSSGDTALNDAVVQGFQKASFVPGSLNGKPIDSSFEFPYWSYPPANPTSGSNDFIRSIKSVTAAIQAKDRPAADAAMQKVKIDSASEDAYFGLATYQYAQVWGDEAEQLKGLRRTLVWPDTDKVLPKNVTTVALLACLKLELQTHEYGEAIATWKRLQKLGVDSATVAKVTPIMQALDQLRLNHQEVAVSGQISDGSWFLELFKPQFRIEVSDGRISDVKLRCQRRYLSFIFDPKLQYQVSGDSGDCTVQVEGTNGTQFKFVEF